jgi:catechol 2,3-dioxygenase-like lactoylglutathione lyase family enzyme
MTAMPTSPATRLASHVSIDTQDLARSGAFYRALFGAEPVLTKPDYVRFWPAELGLVLGLNARRQLERGSGALQHLGILFPDAGALAEARARLAAAGFATHGKENTECCYARLDQFWATDPSGVQWELFLSHEDVVAEKSAAKSSTCCAPGSCA